MAKTEWGLKRHCKNCGARFYDLKNDPIVCPSCEAVFDPLAMLRPKRGRAAAAAQTAKAAAAVVAEKASKPAKPDVESDVEIDDDDDDDDDDVLGVVETDDDDDDVESEDDDDMIEDASELGEGDDVVPTVAVKDDSGD